MATIVNMKFRIDMKCKCCGGSGKKAVTNPAALKEIRKARNLSLRALAKRIGVSAAYLSDIENGHRNCTPYVEHTYRVLKLRETTSPEID